MTRTQLNPSPASPAAAAERTDAPSTGAAASLELTQAWVRLPPAGSAVTAAYLQIRNTSRALLVITGFALDHAAKVELHRSLMRDGAMRMEAVPQLEIPPGATVTLAPGSLHLMVFGLKPKDPVGREPLKLRLTTRDGQVFETPVAARGPQA